MAALSPTVSCFISATPSFKDGSLHFETVAVTLLFKSVEKAKQVFAALGPHMTGTLSNQLLIPPHARRVNAALIFDRIEGQDDWIKRLEERLSAVDDDAYKALMKGICETYLRTWWPW